MKYTQTIFFLFLLWVLPSAVNAEVWSYACAEATTLLRHAQQDVAQKHNRLYQSKLALKLFPDGIDTCQKGYRGFAGGKIHCVNHRSHGGVAIKEVIQAERVLDHATLTFKRRLRELAQACSLPQ